jgi:predicted transposase YbfD/YdcC
MHYSVFDARLSHKKLTCLSVEIKVSGESINLSIQQKTVEILVNTIRNHWSVESNNWQLDVTFNEDRVRVKRQAI